MEHESLLKALTIVLCTAGVTTVVFQRLRQPVVLGYILAGLIVGPHVPIPLIADRHIVETLSEIGVVLLMFSLGLEFSLRKLLRLGPSASVTAIVQCSIMLWLGFLVGRAFGWSTLESLFAGSLIAISSTTIIAKAFDEQGVRGRLRELVVGVLIVEDLIAVLLMAALTALSVSGGLTAQALGASVGRLALFLVGYVGLGLLVVPPAIRAIARLQRAETTLVASVGLCFAGALLAREFGYSVALGAFLAGSLIGDSGEEKSIEHLVQPVRDMFAAIFFVSVGMLIDPKIIVEHWLAVLVFTLVVIFGKILSVALGAFLTGNGIRMSVKSGMSLAQIGEFSFIIAGLGISLGATGNFLYPIAVAVSALTTLTTPWSIRASEPVALWIDRKLPRSLQTFSTLYAGWIEGLRARSAGSAEGAAARRLAKLLVLDAVLLAALVIGASAGTNALGVFLESRWGLGSGPARVVVVVLVAVLAIALLAGVFVLTRRLGGMLAESTLPRLKANRVDLADAPRRALVVTLQLAIALLVGLPLLAITQPFLTVMQGTTVLLVLLAVFGVAFWRSAANLQGHVRAGSEMIAEAVTSSAQVGGAASDDTLGSIAEFLPGLGAPVVVRLGPESGAVGRSLADLNLRGRTGATVLAMSRDGHGFLATAHEVLRAGDVLAVAGTREAVETARMVLESGTLPAEPTGQ